MGDFLKLGAKLHIICRKPTNYSEKIAKVLISPIFPTKKKHDERLLTLSCPTLLVKCLEILFPQHETVA